MTIQEAIRRKNKSSTILTDEDLLKYFKEAISKSPEMRKEEMIEAIKSIKLEPKIVVSDIKFPAMPTPKVSVNVPDIIVPKQPAPIVNVKPADVKIPTTKFPKEMEVRGIKGLFASLVSELKKIFSAINGITADYPLPVILVDRNGKYYQPTGGGTPIMAVGGGGGENLANTGSSPKMNNKTLTSANTEYNFTFPEDTRKFNIKLRAQNALLKIAWVSGESGTNYSTVPQGASYERDFIKLPKGTIVYFQSPSASQVAEIEYWT